MDWGTALWDQHDAIEKHTQLGLDLIDRYVKFVKEKAEIEQNYAKQLKALCKKHSRRGSKEDQEMKFSNQQMFQELLCELNECSTQRENMAENMSQNICVELTKYLHDFKLERKSYLNDVKKIQQNLETSYKQLEASKKRFEKEWKEAEKANLQAEKTEQDPAFSTKADVDKARLNARQHLDQSDECKNDYAVQLQKYNKEQNRVYHTDIPAVLNKLQQMEERRIRKLAEGYGLLADTEIKTLPTINQSLKKISTHSSSTKEKQDSMIVIEQFKSGQVPPSDIEFEDYSQGIRPAVVENTHHTPKVRIKQLFKKNKQGGTIDKNVPPLVEDFSHLPSDQRKKRLQEKIDELNRELQKVADRSEGLNKMRRVYEQNKQLGDPASLEPQINQTTQNITRLKGDLSRYQAWLCAAGGVSTQNNNQTSPYYLTITPSPPSPPDQTDNQFQSSFDEDFDDVPIAQCLALYHFDGVREGEVSMEAEERLSVMNEDLGDGWVRVKKTNGNTGYVPASYIKIV